MRVHWHRMGSLRGASMCGLVIIAVVASVLTFQTSGAARLCLLLLTIAASTTCVLLVGYWMRTGRWFDDG